MNPRIISHFSCGAASAVATKLILTDYKETHDIHIINAYIREEHPDNQRFLTDCEKWFGRSVTILRNEKYNASTHEIFRRRMYMAGRHGAPCTFYLKREVLEAYDKPGDIWVLGYTAEEGNRLDRFLDRNSSRHVLTPLIDRGLTKGDCLAIIQRAGIDLPVMYRLGYRNNNCRGCVKGGMGHWNKVRLDFPEFFNEIMSIQRLIGPGSFFFRDRKTGQRFGLADLPPDAGRIEDEPDVQCGFFCEIAEQDIERKAS